MLVRHLGRDLNMDLYLYELRSWMFDNVQVTDICIDSAIFVSCLLSLDTKLIWIVLNTND